MNALPCRKPISTRLTSQTNLFAYARNISIRAAILKYNMWFIS